MTLFSPPRAARLAAGMGALVLLAGCGVDDPNAFPPTCAKVAILHDAADITVNLPRGQDLTDLIIDGRITRLDGLCRAGKNGGTLDTNLTVSMDLTRGPALATSSTAIPWFIAVARGERIIDKKVFSITTTFPPNTDAISVTSQPVSLALPTPRGLSGADYHIIVGFQLTSDELSLNRQRGRR